MKKDMNHIVILEYFKNQMLNGQKTAIMLQNHFDDNTQATFCSIENNKEIPFATAVIRMRMFMRLNSKNETIFMLRPSINGEKWMQCENFRVKRIINNEGFLHTDDFWNNIHDKGVFEVNQYYFDTVKLIKHPLQVLN